MKIEKIWFQAALWAIFIFLELLTTSSITEKLPAPPTLIFYIFSIILFYADFVILNSESTKQFWQKISYIILCICAYLLICFGIKSHYHFLITGKSLEISFPQYGPILWRGIYFTEISAAIYAAIRYVRVSKENAENEIHRLKEESEKQLLQEQLVLIKNAFLSAQLGRHFLSNVLQLALDQVEQFSPEAGKTLFRAIDVIDYAISLPEQGGLITLDKELEQVNHLIEIARLRFAGEIFLETVTDTSHEQEIRMLPYLLTTFINNVFEHGHLQDVEFPASILISCNPRQLELKTFNKKRSDNAHHGHRIGITNIRARLDNQYGKDAYQLHIDEDARFYNLHFKLKI